MTSNENFLKMTVEEQREWLTIERAEMRELEQPHTIQRWERRIKIHANQTGESTRATRERIIEDAQIFNS